MQSMQFIRIQCSTFLRLEQLSLIVKKKSIKFFPISVPKENIIGSNMVLAEWEKIGLEDFFKKNPDILIPLTKTLSQNLFARTEQEALDCIFQLDNIEDSTTILVKPIITKKILFDYLLSVASACIGTKSVLIQRIQEYWRNILSNEDILEILSDSVNEAEQNLPGSSNSYQSSIKNHEAKAVNEPDISITVGVGLGNNQNNYPNNHLPSGSNFRGNVGSNQGSGLSNGRGGNQYRRPSANQPGRSSQRSDINQH